MKEGHNHRRRYEIMRSNREHRKTFSKILCAEIKTYFILISQVYDFTSVFSVFSVVNKLFYRGAVCA
jgi:hypothetical protein